MQLTALLGKKIYQKQGFLQDGTRVPLTGVSVAGNLISQIKTSDKEGYNALQIGFGTKKKGSKRELGHANKAQISTSLPVSAEASQANSSAKASSVPLFYREIRVDDVDGANLGQQLKIEEIFAPGDIIDVTGISKGKGWAGGVKRWGFHGGPRTHGQSDRERAPGSIGQTTTPGRVYKGKKMAGRMGHDRVTLKNLEIIDVTNDGVLLIKGLVPGSLNSIVTVKKVGENKKFVPLYKENLGNASEQTPSSNDAQTASSESSAQDSSSLSENQPSTENTDQEVKPEAVLDSSEDVQASIVQEANNPEADVDSEVVEGSASNASENGSVATDERVEEKESGEARSSSAREDK